MSSLTVLRMVVGLIVAIGGAANALNYNWVTQVGSVEKGKFADLIAVSRDPLQDVTEMERAKFVMKRGVVVRNGLTANSPISQSFRP